MKSLFIKNIQCNLTALSMAICAMPALFPVSLYAQDIPTPHVEVGDADFRRIDMEPFLLAIDGGAIPGGENLDIKPKLTTSQFYVVDEAYYSQFTFNWTDSNNRVRTSKLTDRATERNHIIRLIEEIYTNPMVPGYRVDFSTYNNKERDDQELYLCPYYPMDVGPYKVSGEVTPPIIGATAVLVELKDSYHGGDTGWSQAIDDIKAVRIITQQMHVGQGTNTRNPGYLFKVNAELNKFFIMSKGYIRRAENTRIGETKLANLFPFYDYFEEFSPSNTNQIVTNGYQLMSNGQQFPVNHNCSTIMQQRHDMVMSPTTDDNNIYPVSQVFFLPDLRFNGDTKHLYENGKEVTDSYVSDEYYSYYAEDQRPYFFFNIIKAQIDNIRIDEHKTIDENGNYTQPVEVDLSWTSTYKQIIGANVPEEFMVYRVVNGVIEDNPVPYDQIKITQDSTTLLPSDAIGNIQFKSDTLDATGNRVLIDQYDIENKIYGDIYGMAVRSHDRTVRVTILEPPLTADSRKVEYIVYGRRHMGTGTEANFSNFTFSTSNYVEGYIEGASSFEVIGLALLGSPVANADILGQRNEYTVTLDLVDHNTDPKSNLKHSHIMKGTEMRLMRYADNSATGEQVGTITLKDDIEYTQYNNKVYLGEITDSNGSRYEFEDKATSEDTYRTTSFSDLAIMRVNTNEDETLADIEAIDKRTERDSTFTPPKITYSVLARLTDHFTVDVSRGDHPAKYVYRLEFHPTKLDDNNEKVIDESTLLISNPVEFSVIKRDLYVGYMGYSEAEIQDDHDVKNLLPQNQLGVAVGVKTNANIKNYEFYAINDNNTDSLLIGRLTRFPDGSFRCDAYDENTNEMVTTSQGSTGNYGGKLPIPLSYTLKEGQDVSLKVNYTNGNSFTSLRTALIPLPTVNIEEVSIKYDKPDEKDNNLHWYNIGISASGANLNGHTLHKVLGNSGEGNYAETIYGIWSVHDEAKDNGFTTVNHPGKENASNPRHNISGRKTLRAAESGTTAEYDFNSEDLPGGDDNPFKMYHKVRLYAQLPDKALIGSPTQTKGYVVADTDGTHGIFSTDANEPTTGVEDVEASQEDAPEVYYNLQGLQVDIETAAPGIYICRQGTKSSKVLKR